MTQFAPPFSYGVQCSMGPAKPEAAPDPRILFQNCPLCEGTNFHVHRTADCSGHPLFHPAISPTMTWMWCDGCAHVFTDGYFSPQTQSLVFSKANKHQEPGWDMEEQRTISAFIVDRVAQ